MAHLARLELQALEVDQVLVVPSKATGEVIPIRHYFLAPHLVRLVPGLDPMVMKVAVALVQLQQLLLVVDVPESKHPTGWKRLVLHR
jgi:hypothetical protein